MLTQTKIIVGIVALAASFFLGLSVRRTPEVRTKLEVKTIEKIVYRDLAVKRNDIKTVITKRDGTKIERIDKSELSKEVHLNGSKGTENRGISVSSETRPDYSVGIETMADLRQLSSYRLVIARRMLGNAWITGSYGNHEIGLGVRFDF